MHGTLVVRVATLAEVRPLQQAVLRPDGPLPGEPPVPEDMQCVGAYDDGVLVGTGAVLRRPWPGPGSLPEPVWQLRSMAVHFIQSKDLSWNAIDAVHHVKQPPAAFDIRLFKLQTSADFLNDNAGVNYPAV